jgi:hypothetical protein
MPTQKESNCKNCYLDQMLITIQDCSCNLNARPRTTPCTNGEELLLHDYRVWTCGDLQLWEESLNPQIILGKLMVYPGRGQIFCFTCILLRPRKHYIQHRFIQGYGSTVFFDHLIFLWLVHIHNGTYLLYTKTNNPLVQNVVVISLLLVRSQHCKGKIKEQTVRKTIIGLSIHVIRA